MNRGKQANNTSGFKGVYYDKRNNNWASSIMAGGKSYWLGYFPTPEAASKAYNKAAKKYHKEFRGGA